jgi:carbon monoxide dehydrogenase subunit G
MAAHVNVTFHQHVDLSAARAYDLLCDWEDHGRWVPLTRVIVHAPDSFTAWTGVGRLSLEDNMRVTDRDDAARSVTIEKTGPVLTGSAGFAVRPFSEDSCVVTWTEQIRVPLVPPFSAALLGAVTRALFRRALRNLPPA